MDWSKWREKLFAFQSTLRRTERHVAHDRRCVFKNFNPRSGERSDGRLPYISKAKMIFQSTLRRTERRISSIACNKVSHISIHAPANGATTHSILPCTPLTISIHAPANGATKVIYGLMMRLKISIHAPANGATELDYFRAQCNFVFQSTLRRTERQLYPIIASVATGFQSTLRRTERLSQSSLTIWKCWNFNPRSGERSDD